MARATERMPLPTHDAIVGVLRLLSSAHGPAEYYGGLLALLTTWTSCRAAAIRVLGASGEIPFVATTGLTPEFVDDEKWLSLDDDDCLCVRVIRGDRVPSDAALRTAGGSLLCSSVREFVARLPPDDPLRHRTRCLSAAHETVVVVRLPHQARIVGVLLLADREPDRATAQQLAFLEVIAPLVAEAVQRFATERALERGRDAARALGALHRIALAPSSVAEFLEAALDRLAGEAWLPPILSVAAVARERRTGAPLAIAARAFAQCPRQGCGGCAASNAPDLQCPAHRAPADPPPLHRVPVTYSVPFAANDAAGGALRVCMFAAHRDPEVEAFLAAAAEVLTIAVQRRIVEGALAERERRFREIIETSAEGFWELDARGTTTFVNQSLGSMLGCEPQEIVGRPIFDFMDDDAAADEREHLANRRREIADRFELRLRRRDGTSLWAHVSETPAFDPDGRYVGARAFVTDVTDRREMQQRLVAAERLSSMGALAAGVGHELNNPLTYVAANLAVAAEALDAAAVLGAPESIPLERVRRALAEAREGADRVRVIVGDLRAFSRADDDEVELVDVRKVLESCASMAQPELRTRARLERAYGDVPPVRACAARLGQVFLNLLVNAAQAISPGQPDRHVVRIVSRRGAAGEVVVEVSDTGSGISEALRHRIFEPFFTTKPVGQGTGLGLSICHGIVASLGGRIEVESEAGCGSTFRVVLPPAAPESSAAEAPRTVPAAVSRRGRILIVDDEPAIRTALCALLERDHDAEAVDGGEEAIARLDAGDRFDVVLCDLAMPRLSGMDLYGEVRRRWPPEADRFVFLSGGAFTGDGREFLAAVPNPRLDKPVDVDELRRVIAERVGA